MVQTLHLEPTTTAAQLLLLCRCILCFWYTELFTLALKFGGEHALVTPQTVLSVIEVFLPVGGWEMLTDPAVCCAEAAVRVSEPQRLPAACPPPAVWEGPLSRHNQIPPRELQV